MTLFEKVTVTMVIIIGLAMAGTVSIFVWFVNESGKTSTYQVDRKVEEVRRLIFCKKKSEEKNLKHDFDNQERTNDLRASYEQQVKNGHCPNRDELKDFVTTRLKLCKEIKNDLDKLVNRKNKAQIFYSYIKEGICPIEMLNENEKIDYIQAKTKMEIIDQIKSKVEKVHVLIYCKKEAETDPKASDLYEYFVKTGKCPNRKKLNTVETLKLEICREVKKDLNKILNKEERAEVYKTYMIAESCPQIIQN